MPIIQNPDFVASPTTRVVTTFSTGVVADLAAILNTAGWTTLAIDTFSGAPRYKMQSGQPPWNTLPVPAYYNAGVKVFITGPVNFGGPARIVIQGMSMDELVVDPFGGSAGYIEAVNSYRVLANPFGCYVRVPGNTGNGKSLIMAALHTPKSMQERVELRNVFFISFHNAFRTSGISQSCFTYIKMASGEFFTFASASNFISLCLLTDPTVVAGVSSAHKPPAKVYNPSGPNYGFLNPAAVAWAINGGNPVKIKGWIYDSYIVSKGYAEGTLQTFPNGNVGEAWTNNPTEDTMIPPGTLFLMNAGP